MCVRMFVYLYACMHDCMHDCYVIVYMTLGLADTSDAADSGPSPLHHRAVASNRRTSAPPSMLQGAVYRVSEADEEDVVDEATRVSGQTRASDSNDGKPYWMDVKPWTNA